MNKIELTTLEVGMLKEAVVKYEKFIALTNKKIRPIEAEALLSALDKLEEARN